MKIKIKKEMVFLLAGVLFGSYESAIAQERWCGDYAFKGFFKDKDIQKELQAFLTPDQIKKIESELTVQLPIQCKGDFLIISGCKPHDCPLENYMLFINKKETQRYLCYWKLESELKSGAKEEGTLTFYGTSLPAPLNFKKIEASFGCNFQEEAIDTFLKALSTLKKEESPEEAIKFLVNKGKRK